MSVPHHSSGTANDMSEYLAGTTNTSHMFGDDSHYDRYSATASGCSPGGGHSYDSMNTRGMTEYEHHVAQRNAGSRQPAHYYDSMSGSRGAPADYDHNAHSASSMYPSYYNGDMPSTASAMPGGRNSMMSTADLFGGGSNSYYAPTSSNFHESRHASVTAARMLESDRLMACAKVKSSFPQPVYGAAKTASAYGEYWE